MIKTVLIVANFFVQLHYVDDGQHVYQLKGTDKGIEYNVTYEGKALPVDDSKKFFAIIEAECDNSIIPEINGMWKNVQICLVNGIKYE